MIAFLQLFELFFGLGRRIAQKFHLFGVELAERCRALECFAAPAAEFIGIFI